MEQAAVTGIAEHVVEYLTPLVPESVCRQKAGDQTTEETEI